MATVGRYLRKLRFRERRLLVFFQLAYVERDFHGMNSCMISSCLNVVVCWQLVFWKESRANWHKPYNAQNLKT